MIKYLIFMDLEYTLGKKYQKYYSPEIIQIGAIKVNRDFEEVDRFNKTVKPERNPVLNNYMVKLTGITQEDIDSAKSFKEVYHEFENWVGDTSEVSFIFWGKESPRVLQREIEEKEYDGKLIIKKYFNFQSYLWSKTGKNLSLRTASELFQSEFEGKPHDAFWDAVNLKNLYSKVIGSTNVNKLWFEGKLKYINEQLMEIANFFAKSKDFAIDITKIITLSNRCTVFMETSDSFTASQREEKLQKIRKDLDEIQNEIESEVLKQFREDTMILQWAIVKSRLPKEFETAKDMLDYWNKVSEKYKFFKKKRRGNFAIRFDQIKDICTKVGNKTYNFYQLHQELPVDVSWFEQG